MALWPASLLAIRRAYSETVYPSEEEGFYTALEHPSRVCRVFLCLWGPMSEKMASAMQKPFLALTSLHLASNRDIIQALPDGFLAGSAPCLRDLFFSGIPFPALPSLLSSARELVSLRLYKIPETGYFSPEALVACLAVMPRLNHLYIQFQRPTSRPSRMFVPPETPVVLPCIQQIILTGSSEYMEDLVAQIDAPQLDRFLIEYLDQLDSKLEVPQLSKFFDRLDHRLFHFPKATVSFLSVMKLIYDLLFILASKMLRMTLIQTSSMLTDVVHLISYILKSTWEDGKSEIAWLEFLCLFTAVKTLRVPEVLARSVAFVLEGLTGEMDM